MIKNEGWTINKKKVRLIILIIILLIAMFFIGAVYVKQQSGRFSFSIMNIPDSQKNDGATNICNHVVNLNFKGECKGSWRGSAVDCDCRFKLGQANW